MNPVSRQLVLCCREQWMAGAFFGLEPWEDGLRLNSSRFTSGRYCLPAIDSGENGFFWGRVVVCANLPPDTALRVYAYASDSKVYGPWANLDQGIKSLSDDELPALKQIFGAPVSESGDFYVNAEGRYLWLMLELAATGAHSPAISKVTVRISGDHMTDYLPAIYREEDFNRRFLSIFDSMFLDMEREIVNLPRRMDYESADAEMLSYLASWMCIEEGEGDELRERLNRAMTEYETQYTVEGIRRSVKRLTGADSLIIEHFTVAPNRPECKNSELYQRLYGENPSRFFVLLPDGTFKSRQEMDGFRRRMETLIPAGTAMELVLLKPCVQLDWHTYLGINSRIGGYVPAAIDEKTTIHYDTTIGGAGNES
ncbi:MAG: hypothetical protein ACOYI3_07210 [Christensenellales bacterium]|jgi:phage tail-like protein